MDRVHGGQRAQVHGGPAAARTWGTVTLHWCAGAWVRRCSSVVAREGEEDKAKLVRGSPEHERWQRGGVTAVARAQ
jgi:hypothetical protein